MLQVRNALPSDIDWLITQLRQFASIFGTAIDVFPDESYARDFMRRMLENHLVLVAEQPGVGLVGFVAGFVTGHVFNPKIKTLTEVFWWVEPTRRGSRAASLLLNAYSSWGRANVDWIWFSTQSSTALKDTSLERRGYRLRERSFLMEVI